MRETETLLYRVSEMNEGEIMLKSFPNKLQLKISILNSIVMSNVRSERIVRQSQSIEPRNEAKNRNNIKKNRQQTTNTPTHTHTIYWSQVLYNFVPLSQLTIRGYSTQSFPDRRNARQKLPQKQTVPMIPSQLCYKTLLKLSKTMNRTEVDKTSQILPLKPHSNTQNRTHDTY